MLHYLKHPKTAPAPVVALQHGLNLPAISPDLNIRERLFTAKAQNPKRARADDPSQEHHPHTRIKSKGSLHQPSNFPLEVWDNLSKVRLTGRALRELGRRNSTRLTQDQQHLQYTPLIFPGSQDSAAGRVSWRRPVSVACAIGSVVAYISGESGAVKARRLYTCSVGDYHVQGNIHHQPWGPGDRSQESRMKLKPFRPRPT